MDPTTLVIVFAFAWGGLMLYRIHRRRGGAEARKQTGGQAPAPAPAPTQQTSMPRAGKPGSISYNQIRALQRNNFTPDRNWSQQEAALILDAVKYLQTVCRDIAGDDDGPPPMEVQNALLRLILGVQDLRDYVRKWGEDTITEYWRARCLVLRELAAPPDLCQEAIPEPNKVPWCQRRKNGNRYRALREKHAKIVGAPLRASTALGQIGMMHGK